MPADIRTRAALAVWSVLAFAAIVSVPATSRAADLATDGTTALAPPPSDPHDIEGVWKPGRSAPPPGSGAARSGPPPAGTPVVAGSTLVCAPVERLGGAGGGMSNLWVVGPKEIVMISEEDQDVRKIYLQAHHPRNVIPQPNGNSIGHWEGDTLVVESSGFNGKAWLSGFGNPTTDAMHLTERMRRRDFGHMDIQLTIDDPKAYTKPWTAELHPELIADTELMEFVCNENERDVRHLVAK